jgi:crotonobetainyl-CoA:carnitine CoA-transferase CaiB-like acyl-CoA transferase
VAPGDLPFAGLRVLDLGSFWAGPYCTMYLGALGADVVKIESTRRPDGFRFSGAVPEMGDDWYERGGVFAGTNLDKRDLTLDLSTKKGRALLLRLVAEADIVLENYSARVVEEFGIGYEQLRIVKPDVIMVRMPGFGLEGPWRDFVGWAMVIEQATGMASLTGPPERPMHPGGLADPVIGMHAAVAVQAALAHREHTGEGQLIEVAQLETGANLTAELVLDWSVRRETPAREGNRDPRMAPQGVYPCRSEGPMPEWVALSVQDDTQWQALAKALERPDWVADRGLATLAGRRARHDEIDDLIATWSRSRSPVEVVVALRLAGLAVAPVLAVPRMYDDPQLVARGYYQELDHARTGTRRYPGWPAQFSFLAQHHRRGAPTLGEHNREILTEDLGLTDAEVDALARDGIIGDRIQPPP